jgi:(p)ppGpp synthase/HD superfamily hydrolase
MVEQTAQDFIHLEKPESGSIDIKADILIACWGHDTIEDTRVSYNDVRKHLGEIAADIVYAVTNEKGKSRKERANSKYYRGIRETRGAVFVKLCDRIANVKYSKLTKSRMFEMYQSENEEFMKNLGWVEGKPHKYEKMFLHLQDLFKNG